MIQPLIDARAVGPGVFTMRTLALVGLTMVTVLAGGGADAQRIGYPGAQYPVPGAYPVQPGGPVTLPAPPARPFPDRPYPPTGAVHSGAHWGAHSGAHWGGSVGGRWSGGTYAPGGWNAYRRPSRGWQMPSYWVSPDFAVSDYASYGLSAPPRGYRWQRYYDDAVLLDDRGRVYESRGGIDWDGGSAYARGGAGGYTSSGDGYGYSEDTQTDGYIASESRHAPPYRPLPPVEQHGAVTTYQSGGYASGYAGGYGATYGAPGTTTTVVTIQPTETVTTTTTEYVEETHAATRRVYRAPRKHYRVVRRACGCGCCR